MKRNDSEQNKVILIGEDHHNGLGLVRSFGRHGVAPYGVIVGSSTGKSYTRKSKYWANTWAVETDNDAVELIMREFKHESKKPVVIPWSDSAAQTVDLNLDRLKPYFILPSIGGKQGAIAALMDKKKQVDFANRYGLKMLPSEIVELTNPIRDRTISLPVILKPVESVDGKKSDIVICKTVQQYQDALQGLISKNFSRILVQKFLEKRDEYVVIGAVSDKRFSMTIVKNERIWPADFGTGSFSTFVISEKENTFSKAVLQKIMVAGYRGPIDFEFFQDPDGQIYLNEINWRSSGRNFVSEYTDIPSAFIYYCDVTNQPYEAELINNKTGFSMNEVTDIRHILKGNIGFARWMKDLKAAANFSVWDVKDLKPVIARYFALVCTFVKKGHL